MVCFRYMQFLFKSNKYTCIPLSLLPSCKYYYRLFLCLGYACILLVLVKNIHIPRSLDEKWIFMIFMIFYKIIVMFCFWASLIIFMKILITWLLYTHITSFVYSWLCFMIMFELYRFRVSTFCVFSIFHERHMIWFHVWRIFN